MDIPASIELDGFAREAECKAYSGLSRSTRFDLEKKGLFPKRVQISPNAVGWRRSELRAWAESRQQQKAA